MDKLSIRDDRYESGCFYPVVHSEGGKTLWIGRGGDSVDGRIDQFEEVESEFNAKPWSESRDQNL